jgi:hypothetical protein
MLRALLRFYWPDRRLREVVHRAELVPRWGMTGLVLFLLAVGPAWPSSEVGSVDGFLVAQTILACSGVFCSGVAVVISVVSIRPRRR